MNIAASTVIVYFIGLITFYDVTISGAKVSVPLTTAGETHKTVPLEKHFADVVVKGFAGTAADCATKGGVWTPTTPAAPAICTFKKVSGKTLQLPGSTTAFSVTGNFPKVPHIQTLCPDATGINAAYDNVSSGYTAARVDLMKGNLDACTNGYAWVSKLTLGGPTGDLKIGAVSVPLALDGDVIVAIINAPEMSTGMPEESHFYWYYKMYAGAELCGALPEKDAHACNPDLSELGFPTSPYSTGVGCSNTQYP